MNKIVRIFAAAGLSALLPALIISCVEKPEEKAASVLSVNPAEVCFEYTGGTATVNVSSSIKPSVNFKSDWIEVMEGPYAGGAVTLTITAAENATTSPRECIVYVNGEQKTEKITVSQKIKTVKLSADVSSISCNSRGGVYKIATTSTSAVSVNTRADWFSVKTGSIGNDNHTTIDVFVAPNRSGSDKNESIIITCGEESLEIGISQPAITETAMADTEPLTPEMVFDALRMGWNLGNQMDAFSNDVASETIWGNPKATQATFNAIKAAGFSSVRIPVTWLGHIGDAPYYEIESKWLDRVYELVCYAENAGLAVIINTHHDENNADNHWLNIKSASSNAGTQQKILTQLYSMWSQIAERFKDKGEWLIFEPFNEIQDGGWGWSSSFQSNPQPQYDALNEWNQAFVDAVRSTGGMNSTRWLSVVGYSANPGFTIKGLKIPEDYTTTNRLIVGVHDYDPYNYTLANPLTEQWGHTADKSKRCSDTDEANVTAVFDNLVETYLSKGIPVYIGEMGCSFHRGDDFKYQKYYIEYFCKAAADRMLPMFVWDNGVAGEGPECHGYMNHGDGSYMSDRAREIVETMVKAVNCDDEDYTLQSVFDSAP